MIDKIQEFVGISIGVAIFLALIASGNGDEWGDDPVGAGYIVLFFVIMFAIWHYMKVSEEWEKERKQLLRGVEKVAEEAFKRERKYKEQNKQ